MTTFDIPLRQAVLPPAKALAPYLEQIDESRWYSNFGRLSRALEARLGEHFGVAPDNVLCTANGTEALILALSAVGADPGGVCVIPSFTFVATPAAVLNADMSPYFADVDQESWTLDQAAVQSALDRDERVSAVVPVSPFGSSLDTGAWDRFAARRDVAVIHDAAWAFDSLDLGDAPAMVSLHATKSLGCGEGGVLLCRDAAFVDEARQRANFGLAADRTAHRRGRNAKMSEYAAAVGLAAMDAWPDRRAAALEMAAAYLEHLTALDFAAPVPGFGQWAGATCPVRLARPVAHKLPAAMAEQGIEVRAWWGTPCHRHAAFSAYRAGPLAVTDLLAASVINLPFSPTLTRSDIERVCDALDTSYRAVR